jgi:NAD(P)-dependent dehydrogenase (short-subunit alcohol dehydrogenase family)
MTSPSFSSADRAAKPVVLITGGARRSGFVIATEFAKNGFNVAIQYRTSSDEAERAQSELNSIGIACRAYQADLNDAAEIKGLVEGVFEDFGRLDVLVNNASVFFQDQLKDFDIENLDEAWRVNCRAPILLTKAFYDRASKSGMEGAVINIVDQKVKGNFHADHFSYTVAKTAIGQLTNMLAVSCLPVLRVNAIFPGLMLPSDTQTNEDFEYAAKVSTPLGYAATPLDLARTAVELSNRRYNGTDIVLDAGQNLIRVDQDVIYKYKSPNGGNQS